MTSRILSSTIPLPDYTSFSVKETADNKIILATQSLSVEIEQSPLFRVIFKNAQGAILNENTQGESLATAWLQRETRIRRKWQTRRNAADILDPLGDLEPIYFDKEQFHALRDKETTLQQELLIVENTPEIVISWD